MQAVGAVSTLLQAVLLSSLLCFPALAFYLHGMDGMCLLGRKAQRWSPEFWSEVHADVYD